MINKRLLIILLLLTAGLSARANVTLQTGESYLFDVLLAPQGAGQGTNYGAALYFAGGLPAHSWTALMEFFPEAATDPNLYTGTYTHFGAIPSSDILGYTFSFNPELPSPYPDFQGTVRVTSLGGQFDLYSLWAYETIGGESFSSYILAVPEPAFSGLVVVALGGLFFYRERSKQRDPVNAAALNPEFRM